MFEFPFRDINETLTWLLVSPECQRACAKDDPGPELESTSCKKKDKPNKNLYINGSKQRKRQKKKTKQNNNNNNNNKKNDRNLYKDWPIGAMLSSGTVHNTLEGSSYL